MLKVEGFAPSKSFLYNSIKMDNIRLASCTTLLESIPNSNSISEF